MSVQKLGFDVQEIHWGEMPLKAKGGRSRTRWGEPSNHSTGLASPMGAGKEHQGAGASDGSAVQRKAPSLSVGLE